LRRPRLHPAAGPRSHPRPRRAALHGRRNDAVEDVRDGSADPCRCRAPAGCPALLCAAAGTDSHPEADPQADPEARQDAVALAEPERDAEVDRESLAELTFAGFPGVPNPRFATWPKPPAPNPSC